jgi:dipeptidyl aminopeptidase/acylaminoacyl peptidase
LARITLEEILAVKRLEGWSWSADGRWISYLWNDGGLTDCWLVPLDGGAPQQLTQAKRRVVAASWHPRRPLLALVADGDLYWAEPDGDSFSLRRLTVSANLGGTLNWSPDGRLLLLKQGNQTYLLEDGQLWQRVQLPGREMATAWSADSRHLLIRYTDEHHTARLAIITAAGRLLWASDNTQTGISDAHWLDNRRFIYQVSRDIRRVHDWYLATLPESTEGVDYSRIGVTSRLRPEIRHLYHEEQADRRGALSFSRVLPSPDGEHLLFSLELDGWLHHYLYDLAAGQLEQLTDGQCEDFGAAGDRPDWSPDGRQFVYSSNRGDLLRRDLWLYDLPTRSQRRLTDFPVTNLQARWSPDGRSIAFVHCDARLAADLWVVDLADGQPRQLTNCMPGGLAEKLQVPEKITYRGAEDWELDGFLFKPDDLDPQRKYPALVWLHGGPIRQMRGSWHPSYSYAHFYAVNQYLASRGYVVLSINYRGGIGYGKDFRFGLYRNMGVNDVLDVVHGGRYLKSLPYVDADRVGVYGLSYGGYLTLHCLTQYPDEFALGINFAGIWDQAQWARWIEGRGRRGGTQFACFFCGLPEDSPELYAQGSPVTFRENLNKPLINFHGTEDANVDFAQLDRIVTDCVNLGKEYEAYYYPGEVHMFARRQTWRDALPKMERALEKYLRQE